MVENVIRVLQPFEEITKITSFDYETIEYVILVVVTLHSYLSKQQKDAGVAEPELGCGERGTCLM